MLLIAIISLAFVFDGNRYYYSRILLFNQRKLSNFLYDSMCNTVLCRMGRLLFIALSILKTIIALILWIIEEIKKPQTCTNQEVKPSELPHPIFDDDIVIKTLPKRI